MTATSRVYAIAATLVLISAHAALSGSNEAPVLAGHKADVSRPLVLAESQLSCETAKSQCEDDCGNGDPEGCESMPGGCGAQKPTPKWKQCIAACQETFSGC